MRRTLLAALLATTAACSGPEGAVRIDASSVFDAARQSSLVIEKFELRVTAADLEEPVVVEIDPDDPIFEFDIVAGPGRLFVAQATTTGGLPIFWGDVSVDIEPRTTTDVVVPAFPAGRIAGNLAVFGTDLPNLPALTVRITAEAPRNDQRTVFRVPVASDGSFAQTVPTGTHTLATSLTLEGTEFTLVPAAPSVEVIQGEQVAIELRLVDASACAPELGQTPDLDNDGLACDVDCDDTNPNCGEDCSDSDGDGFCIDHDCDDSPETGAACNATCTAFFGDDDGDGLGDETKTRTACAAPTGFVSSAGDCDDTNAGCLEDCTDLDGDGFCGALDCDDSAESGADCHDSCSTFFADNDNDGIGDDSTSTTACMLTAGFVAVGGDCDDSDGTRFPGNLELCNGVDNDCDTIADNNPADGLTFYPDNDLDGFGDSADPGTLFCSGSEPADFYLTNTDCDDTNDEIFPGSPEICDGLDNDCDGGIDDNPSDGTAFFVDADLDGLGDPGPSPSLFCPGDEPAGFVANSNDCDDTRELCGIDCTNDDGDEACAPNDCDDSSATGAGCVTGCTTLFEDYDKDGFGNPLSSITSCSGLPGYVADNTDCDDLLDYAHPGAQEIPGTGVDEDCDTFELCYGDSDDDGAGDVTLSLVSTTVFDCSGANMAHNALDCDDSLPGFHRLDLDNDGEDSCGDYFGGGDCDDSDPLRSSRHFEHCNDGIDNDCDGLIDGADSDCFGWPGGGAGFDADGDGYPDMSESMLGCDSSNPAETPTDLDNDGYTNCGFESIPDCDDTDANASPGRMEKCGDGIDNDCNGLIDDGCPCPDADSDGYCDSIDCDPNDPLLNWDDADRDNVSSCAGDCDETWKYAPFPGLLTEYCYDGRDNNCDGRPDFADSECSGSDNDLDGFFVSDCDDDPITGPECFDGCSFDRPDLDGDGFGAGTARSVCSVPLFSEIDCDDSATDVYPGAPELCDLIDQDCDGATRDVDRDRDGAIDAACDDGDPTNDDCDDLDPSKNTADLDGDGVSSCAGDCDDTLASIKPGAEEICDGRDNDCSGEIDDILNSGVRDSDGDGIDDCFDNCPTTAQTVTLEPKPGYLEVRWMSLLDAVDTPADFRLLLNDTEVATFSDTALTTCGTQPARIAPDLTTNLATAPWNGDGSDRFTVEVVGTGSTEQLSWMDIGRGVSSAQVFECVFGPCVQSDPCSGATCIPGTDCGFPHTVQLAAPPFPDQDGDGVGDACEPLACQSDPLVQPGGIESCANGIDDDCDGDVDFADIADCPTDCSTGVDVDGDGFFANSSCLAPIFDCDDSAATSNPGIPSEAAGLCHDGLDNDCDGAIDDLDSDCFGTSLAAPITAFVDLHRNARSEVALPDVCAGSPSGLSCGATGEKAFFAVTYSDPDLVGDSLQLCNRNPFAVTLVNVSGGIETNCDAELTPDACTNVFVSGSGVHEFGVQANEVRCSGGKGEQLRMEVHYIPSFGCEDRDRDFIPDCQDPCIDADGDGFGEMYSSSFGCPGGEEPDCNDHASAAYPGGAEVCDGLDNDCDGQIDEGVAGSALFSYDMETVSPLADGWTQTPLSGTSSDWSLATETAATFIALSSTFIGTNGAFDGPEDSVLESKSFAFADGKTYVLRFTSFTNNEGGCPGGMGLDGEELEFSPDDGANWSPLISCPDPVLNRPYDPEERDLGYVIPFSGAGTGKVRFHFNSGPNDSPSADGWYIDNVKVYECL